jgi:hypothetical protein
MNQENLGKLKDQLCIDYTFTTIDEQPHLAALHTHLNEQIAHLDFLLDQLALEWDDNSEL